MLCLLPGVTMKMLDGRAILAHPDGPPMIVDLATMQAGWLTASGKMYDRPAPWRGELNRQVFERKGAEPTIKQE